MAYSNSSLVKYTKISPNKNSPRNHTIDRITPHCYVGQTSVESMAGWLCHPNSGASSNYGIGADGRIGLFVEEKDRSWCSSSRENDNRAVTIECASANIHPYTINDSVYKSLIALMTDICKRNGKKKLLWFGDKDKTLKYSPKSDEMIITVHRWFANKACPGDYIYSRLGQIANAVTVNLGSNTNTQIEPEHWYRIRKTWADAQSQLGAYKNKDTAISHCPIGYSVFDWNGKAVYTNPDNTSTYEKGKGIPKSKKDFIKQVSDIAIKLYPETKILPSVVIAQCCLETGYGLGSDSVELMKHNNLLGMKSKLLNSTWSDYTVWDGKSFSKITPEVINGKTVYKKDSFRSYKDYENCILDYERFLINVKNGSAYKYRDVVGLKNPKSVITIISTRGYATDPSYVDKVMNLISSNNLTQYDENLQEISNSGAEEMDMSLAAEVRTTAKLLNDVVINDIQNGVKWIYYNSGQKKTFDAARSSGVYRVNCALGVIWVYKYVGIFVPNFGNFYGQNGKFICSDTVKTSLSKLFEFIDFQGKKTSQQLVKDKVLKPGDIISYTNMTHTNMYLEKNQFFDTGHAFCKTKSGDGAEFTKWIGTNPYPDQKVGCVLRLKEINKQWRVQYGIYKLKTNAINMKSKALKAGLPAVIEQDNNEYIVQAGLFSVEQNAINLKKKIEKAKLPCLIKEI